MSGSIFGRSISRLGWEVEIQFFGSGISAGILNHEALHGDCIGDDSAFGISTNGTLMILMRGHSQALISS